MTENDLQDLISGKPNTYKILLRLGAYFLSAFMIFSLIFISGSFSSYTSLEGSVETTEFLLTVSEFDVAVEEEGDDYSSGDPFDDCESIEGNLMVLYAFTIFNNSGVNITYDMTFDNIVINFDGLVAESVVKEINIFLFDGSALDNAMIQFEAGDTSDEMTIGWSTTDEKNSGIVNKEFVWEEVILDTDSNYSRIYYLVAQFGGGNKDWIEGDDYTISAEGTIIVTAYQVIAGAE